MPLTDFTMHSAPACVSDDTGAISAYHFLELEDWNENIQADRLISRPTSPETLFGYSGSSWTTGSPEGDHWSDIQTMDNDNYQVFLASAQGSPQSENSDIFPAFTGQDSGNLEYPCAGMSNVSRNPRRPTGALSLIHI